MTNQRADTLDVSPQVRLALAEDHVIDMVYKLASYGIGGPNTTERLRAQRELFKAARAYAEAFKQLADAL